MPKLVSKEKKLTLIWTEKAACSTAVGTFFDYIGFPYDKKVKVHDSRLKYDRLQQRDNPNYTHFQIVRNPYTRAVSSYLHCLMNNFQGIVDRELSFLEMLKLVGNRPNKDPAFDSHTRPQYQEKVKHIIKIENAEEDLKKFEKQTGHKLVLNTIKHHSHSEKLNKDIGYPMENRFYTYDYIKTYCNDYSLFYNKETRKLVEKVYRKDIQYFNYDYPW